MFYDAGEEISMYNLHDVLITERTRFSIAKRFLIKPNLCFLWNSREFAG